MKMNNVEVKEGERQREGEVAGVPIGSVVFSYGRSDRVYKEKERRRDTVCTWCFCLPVPANEREADTFSSFVSHSLPLVCFTHIHIRREVRGARALRVVSVSPTFSIHTHTHTVSAHFHFLRIQKKTFFFFPSETDLN